MEAYSDTFGGFDFLVILDDKSLVKFFGGLVISLILIFLAWFTLKKQLGS